jgi:hypothetical protein
MAKNIIDSIAPLPSTSGEDKIRMHNDSNHTPSLLGRILLKILSKWLKKHADSWQPDNWPPSCSTTSSVFTTASDVEDEDGYTIELHVTVYPLKTSAISTFAKVFEVYLHNQFVTSSGIRRQVPIVRTRIFKITLDTQAKIPANPQENFSVTYKDKKTDSWSIIIQLYKEKYNSKPTLENCTSYLKLKFVGGVLPERDLSRKLRIDD